MLVKTAVSPGRLISFFFISPSRCVADKSELVLRWNKNRGGIKWSGSGLPRSHSHLMSWNGRDGGKMAAVAGDKTATTSAPPNQTIRRRSINRLRLSTEKVRVAQKKRKETKRNRYKPEGCTGRLCSRRTSSGQQLTLQLLRRLSKTRQVLFSCHILTGK